MSNIDIANQPGGEDDCIAECLLCGEQGIPGSCVEIDVGARGDICWTCHLLGLTSFGGSAPDDEHRALARAMSLGFRAILREVGLFGEMVGDAI